MCLTQKPCCLFEGQDYTFGINDQHDKTMCRVQKLWQKFKGQGHTMRMNFAHRP